jgi:hypothetical protein
MVTKVGQGADSCSALCCKKGEPSCTAVTQGCDDENSVCIRSRQNRIEFPMGEFPEIGRTGQNEGNPVTQTYGHTRHPLRSASSNHVQYKDWCSHCEVVAIMLVFFSGHQSRQSEERPEVAEAVQLTNCPL